LLPGRPQSVQALSTRPASIPKLKLRQLACDEVTPAELIRPRLKPVRRSGAYWLRMSPSTSSRASSV
jgi:hypothetical protein